MAGEEPSPELILASTSPARRAMLDALGIPYQAMAPELVERIDSSLSPAELVRALALGKARAVAGRFPGAVVVAADQVAAFEGEVWGKPEDAADAQRKLEMMSGKTHELVTGIAVIAQGREWVEHEVAHLTLHPLSQEEIARYVQRGEWEGCAGGYRIEGAGLALFSEVRGDWTGVRGLPMVRLVRLLRAAGVRFF